MVISLYLKRPDASTDTVIYARIRYAGQELKYYLPETIHPKYWNKETQRAKQTAKFPGYPEFNALLDKYISDIKDIYRSFIIDIDRQPHTKELKEVLDRELKKVCRNTAHTLFTFIDEIIDLSQKGVRLNPKGNTPIAPRTIKSYKTTRKYLELFSNDKGRELDFKDLDLSFYHDFIEFMQKDYQLTNNALGVHIKNLKMFLGEASERGLTDNYAFRGKRFKTVREDTDSIYLERLELVSLEALDLTDKPRLETVRDLFLIGCYTGLRYSDFTRIQPENINNGLFEIRQHKTGDAVVIPVHPTVQMILDKYHGQLPRPISNQKSNDYLKEIGKLCPELHTKVSRTYTKAGKRITRNYQKWELLTTHTARRSFATNEYKAGTPTITIMSITGHKTEKAFMRYIKVTPDEHAKIMLKMWQERGEFLRVAK